VPHIVIGGARYRGCARYSDRETVKRTARTRPQSIAFIFLVLLFVCLASGSIYLPGKYNGIVIFDRWDACYLYGGNDLMPVSERVKESLRAFDGRAVSIDAEEIEQRSNPGVGLIKKLKVLGLAVDQPSGQRSAAYFLRGLSLHVAADFRPGIHAKLVIQLRNDTKDLRTVDVSGLAPTLFTRKQAPMWLQLADGPSFPAITGSSVGWLYRGPRSVDYCSNGAFQLSIDPDLPYLSTVRLDPGKSVEIPLYFRLSPGEYEFLAGYGGSGYQSPPLASNLLVFDVDQAGIAHALNGDEAATPELSPRRVTAICGQVMRDDGRQAAGARVILWPFPSTLDRPLAQGTTLADANGRYRIETVAEGQYALSATLSEGDAVLISTPASHSASDAAAIAVTDAPRTCFDSLTVHPSPVYTLRGRITPPGESYAGSREIRLTMVHGDAFPLERTGEVLPDGRFEFSGVPAGFYNLQAGNTGWGDSVPGESGEVVKVMWPTATSGNTAGPAPHSVAAPITDAQEAAANEDTALYALRTLYRAQLAYSDWYAMGFAGDLSLLGQPPDWCRATADHAALIDTRYGTFRVDDGTHFSTSGYRLTYLPLVANAAGQVTAYTIAARPREFGKTGTRSFLLDERGVVHSTSQNRAATRQDPPAGN
jgi:hypothetical protein